MAKALLEKLKESAQSVLPVAGVMLILHLVGLAPLPGYTFWLFLTGTVFLILGMGILSLGADMAMMPIGEAIGAELTKSKKLWIIVISALILGFVVTIAEPDLQVLTRQVPGVPDMVLVLSVAAGVGLFLVLALLRILFQFSLRLLFIISYSLVFIVAAIGAPEFLAVAFDSGGVTTGPITVPFILSLGVGVSAVRGSKNAEEDSFGLCALCSIGPIIAVLIMGIFFKASAGDAGLATPDQIHSFGQMVSAYLSGFAENFMDVILVLLPIVVIFLGFQLFRLRMSHIKVIKILVGIVYTLVGLTIFLVGVNVGFVPAGKQMGAHLAGLDYNWVLLPLSAVIGFFIVFAEPAVHMLNKQVEEITSGAISRKMMMTGLAIAVSLALVLSVVRIMLNISAWYILLPGYILALVLTFFTPRLFTAIAFDSGGVAAGTMTAAFLLPFAVGIAEVMGADIMTQAFGIIALVATMPLITIQVLGIIYNIKLKKNRERELALDDGPDDIPLPEAPSQAPDTAALLADIFGAEAPKEEPAPENAVSLPAEESAEEPANNENNGISANEDTPPDTAQYPEESNTPGGTQNK